MLPFFLYSLSSVGVSSITISLHKIFTSINEAIFRKLLLKLLLICLLKLMFLLLKIIIPSSDGILMFFEAYLFF